MCGKGSDIEFSVFLMVLIVRSEDAEGLYSGKMNWSRFI